MIGIVGYTFWPFARLVLAGSILGMTWFIWCSMPASPIEVREIRSPSRWQGVDLGPELPKREHFLCGTGIDFTRLPILPDSTWTVRKFQGGLQALEMGIDRPLGTWPQGDYRNIRGSEFGRRLSFWLEGLYQIWDLDSRQELCSISATIDEFQITSSGQHYFHAEPSDQGHKRLIIHAVGRVEPLLNIQAGYEIAIEGKKTVVKTPNQISFSGDGKWAVLGFKDAENNACTVVWNLKSDPPVPLTLRIDTDRASFDHSSRYLFVETISGHGDTIFDMSVSPPRQLKTQIANPKVRKQLGDRRMIALDVRGNVGDFIVVDLDQDREIARHHLSAQILDSTPFSPLVVTPDQKYVLFSCNSQSNTLHQYLQTALQFIGYQWRPGAIDYFAFDLQTGQEASYFSTHQLTHFGVDLESVWSRQVFAENPESVRVVLERFPLRAAGPPWWLWLLSAVGGLAMIRNLQLLFQKRNLVYVRN